MTRERRQYSQTCQAKCGHDWSSSRLRKNSKYRFLWSRLRIGAPCSQPLTEPRPKGAEQLVGFFRTLLGTDGHTAATRSAAGSASIAVLAHDDAPVIQPCCIEIAKVRGPAVADR